MLTRSRRVSYGNALGVLTPFGDTRSVGRRTFSQADRTHSDGNALLDEIAMLLPAGNAILDGTALLDGNTIPDGTARLDGMVMLDGISI